MAMAVGMGEEVSWWIKRGHKGVEGHEPWGWAVASGLHLHALEQLALLPVGVLVAAERLRVGELAAAVLTLVLESVGWRFIKGIGAVGAVHYL